MPLLDTRTHKDLIGTFLSDIVLQILSFVSQNECENIRKRQAQGICAAKAKGVKFGRPSKKTPTNFAELVRKLERKQISFDDVLSLCDMKATTFYKKLAEHRIIAGKTKNPTP